MKLEVHTIEIYKIPYDNFLVLAYLLPYSAD